MEKKILKKVLKLDLSGVEKEPGIPDIFDLYSELITSEDIDEDLDKSHVMYSFCAILAEEFNFQARVLEAELEAWAGERWRKLKSSVKHKYTDNDAKRKIESSPYYLKARILILKYDKLYKQLAFGGGKSFDMKYKGIIGKIYREYRLSGDFNLRDSDEGFKKVEEKIRNRLSRKKGK